MNATATMRRNIIKIDEDKCDGCGDCIPGCPEGALQIINGKARLVGEVLCDGLGACIGRCPKGAITIEEREAPEYDERQVMANVLQQGPDVVQAHLDHLREHNEQENLRVAMTFLRDKELQVPLKPLAQTHSSGGCPGSRSMSFHTKPTAAPKDDQSRSSQLTHWPIQLHLLNPGAPHYQGADVLLAADCVPFAVADFHKDFLRGKRLAIACPKLDQNQEVYVRKLATMVDTARVNTLTVMIMQVPCCQGLLRLAQSAVAQAQRKVPIRCIVASLQGEILEDAWV